MSANIFLKLCDRLSIGIRAQMCIPFHHVEAGMPQQVGDAVEGDSFNSHPRSIGVAQGMEYDLVPVLGDSFIESDALNSARVCAADSLHDHTFATGENKTPVLDGPFFKRFPEFGGHVQGAAFVVLVMTARIKPSSMFTCSPRRVAISPKRIPVCRAIRVMV